MENKFEINNYRFDGVQIGSFLFRYREVDNNGEKEVEMDVYKLEGPVLIYVKTYRAPYIEEGTPEGFSEALYEEFFMQFDEEEK